MKNENTEKKEWQAPEVIDLDVKNTESGPLPYSVEFTVFTVQVTHLS